MQSVKDLIGVDAKEVLAILIRDNGYVGYLKFHFMGELNGFRPMSDSEVDTMVSEGVVVADARGIEAGDQNRLSYLNTVAPQTDASHGPAGLHHRAPLEFWLPVMASSGARIYNADVLPLSSSMFTPEYADRLRSERIELIEDGSFSVPKVDEFLSLSHLIRKLGTLNVESKIVRDGEKVVTEMQNLVTGEAIIARRQGKTAQDALHQSAKKLADRIAHVETIIEKVPTLKDKLPLNTIFESAKMINEEVGRKVEPASKTNPPGLG